MQLFHRADGLRQLHERQDPLLHARATGARDGDQRHAAHRRGVAGPGELLPHDAAHRAAHEREIHHGELALLSVERCLADHHRVREAGRHLRLGEPLGVRPEIEERERILGMEVGGLLRERARVGERVDPGP